MSDVLSRAEVARIAELAHLELTDAEAEAFSRQLGDILAYATQVQALDTSGVPPTSHVLNDATVDRADVEAPSLDRQIAVTAAPDGDEQAGLFRVPRVIG
jgi:aspartyl-tRNA(Asn)/glutamyl-tRNA(Gln) amidotransferase subunit C